MESVTEAHRAFVRAAAGRGSIPEPAAARTSAEGACTAAGATLVPPRAPAPPSAHARALTTRPPTAPCRLPGQRRRSAGMQQRQHRRRRLRLVGGRRRARVAHQHACRKQQRRRQLVISTAAQHGARRVQHTHRGAAAAAAPGAGRRRVDVPVGAAVFQRDETQGACAVHGTVCACCCTLCRMHAVCVEPEQHVHACVAVAFALDHCWCRRHHTPNL